MEKPKDKNHLFTILIVVVIAAVVFFVYHFFFADRFSAGSIMGEGLTEGVVVGGVLPEDVNMGINVDDLEASDFSSSAMTSEQLIALLNQLQGINLESSSVETAMFEGLIDNSVEVPGQDPGKPNPFSPASPF